LSYARTDLCRAVEASRLDYLMGAKVMRVLISWIIPEKDDSITSGVEWPGYFEESMPVVGDTIVEPREPGSSSVDACEVMERYVYFADDNEEVWHLICKYVELKPGRREAFRLVELIEG
jgi:hypothetical protein